ncbi:hypothetical protein QZH41_011240 [Actinostola sp. cb2023]|nr:hypothetical protein QZH41_011240 [Actinostola sp. cb2023]
MVRPSRVSDDHEALASAQETFNKSVEEWNDRKRRLTDFLDSFQASISSNNSSISHLEKKRGELEEFQCLKHLSFKADAALDKLKLSTKRSSQQIKNLKNKLNLSNRNIASLRKRLTEIEAQISDRNEAKDIAKKERNFKEAKRLKEEGEALNVEGIESQKKLEDIFEELNTDTSLLKNAEKEFEKMAEELKEKEYESGTMNVTSTMLVMMIMQGMMMMHIGGSGGGSGMLMVVKVDNDFIVKMF